MPLAMITMGIFLLFSLNQPISTSQKTYYNNYVRQLYSQLTYTPMYTSAQILANMKEWLAANPPPNASAFTDLTRAKELGIFSFLVKETPKQGFMNYEGTYSHTKLLPTSYHRF
jgi:hypothetical protein